MDNKMDIRGCLEEELRQIVVSCGLKAFRARQLIQWVQQRAVQGWDEISNISVTDKEKLTGCLSLAPMKLLREQRSSDGTRKYLFEFADGENVECVLMDYVRRATRNRNTICVSTQVGCPVGCAFCATGLGGFRRNLSAGEIVSEVLDITHLMRKEDEEFHITNVVFMGMGEPLLNQDNVFKAIDILNHENGQKIGMRRMTISTSGVVPGILELARKHPQVGLAVSLHAARDDVRDSLVPINRKYPLAELMDACLKYSEITHRRITFEIALTQENGNRESAKGFARLLKGQLAHVNLIPVNPVAESGMLRPDREGMQAFAEILSEADIPVTIREERGTDINAACGQLRRQWKDEQS